MLSISPILRLIYLNFSISFTMTSNRIIAFFKRFYIFRGLLESGTSEWRMAFSIIGLLYMMGKRVMGYLFYTGLLLLIGLIFSQISHYGGYRAFIDSDDLLGGLTSLNVISVTLVAWFFSSFVVGGLMGVRSTLVNKNSATYDETMINYFRAAPAVYAKSRILFNRCMEILIYLPLLIIAFSTAKLPIWGVAVLLVMLTGFRLMGEALNLCLFKRFGIQLGQPVFKLLGYVLFLCAFVATYFIGIIDISSVLSNPITTAISFLTGIIALTYIRKYALYNEFLKYKINKNSSSGSLRSRPLNSDFSFMDLNSAQKWSKHLKTTGLSDEKFKKKEGFAYLNAIFFDRHKKYFRDKLFLNLAIPLAIAAGVVMFCLFHPPSDSFESSRDMFVSAFNYSPVFFFFIYILGMGKIVTASIFSNCDIQMLNYPYFRTRETVINSFKSRFTVILRYNLVFTTIMSIAVLAAVAAFFNGMDFTYAGVFFVLITSLGILFSFNDLFLYYILQPYDSDGSSNSVAYKFINMTVYLLAFLNYQARLELFTYTIVICSLTVVYMAVGTYLLRTLAPKNFKLK